MDIQSKSIDWCSRLEHQVQDVENKIFQDYLAQADTNIIAQLRQEITNPISHMVYTVFVAVMNTVCDENSNGDIDQT